MRLSNNQENKAPSDTYWQFSYYMKFQAGSHFLWTTTGIQSGPDTFHRSRFIMTFWTKLGVTEILCSVRLVVEGKVGKGIPKSSSLEFLEKFLGNNFAWQICRRQHLKAIE